MKKEEDLSGLIGNARFTRLSFCILASGERNMAIEDMVRKIHALKVKNYEVLVAGCPPPSLNRVTSIEVPELVANKEWNKIRNILLQEAKHPVVVFIREDTCPDPNFYDTLLGFYDDFDILNLRVLNPDGTRHWDWASRGGPLGDRLVPYDEQDEFITACPALFIAKRDTLRSVLFNESQDPEIPWEIDLSERMREYGGLFTFCPDASASCQNFLYTQTEDFTRYIFNPSERYRLPSGVMLRGGFEPTPGGMFPIAQTATLALPVELAGSDLTLSLLVSILHPDIYDICPVTVAFKVNGQLVDNLILDDEYPDGEVILPVPATGEAAAGITIECSSRGVPLLLGDYRYRATPSLIISDPIIDTNNLEVPPPPQETFDFTAPIISRGLHLVGPFFTASASSTWLRSLMRVAGELNIPVWPDSEGTVPEIADSIFNSEFDLAVWHRAMSTRPVSGPLLAAFALSEIPDPKYLSRLKTNFHFLAPTVALPIIDSDPVAKEWRDFLRGSEEVWVISETQKALAVTCGASAGRTHIMPLGLDLAAFSPEVCQPLDLNADGRFVFLADLPLSGGSGWDILLRAYLATFTADDDVMLILRSHTLAGEFDTVTRRVDAFARSCGIELEEAAPVFIVDSSLGDHDLPSLYTSANAVISPYRHEVLPISLMMGAAAGLPLISSDLPTCRELLQEDFTFFVPFDGGAPSTQELAAVMTNIARLRDQTFEIGERARGFAMEHFAMEETLAWICERLEIEQCSFEVEGRVFSYPADTHPATDNQKQYYQSPSAPDEPPVTSPQGDFTQEADEPAAVASAGEEVSEASLGQRVKDREEREEITIHEEVRSKAAQAGSYLERDETAGQELSLIQDDLDGPESASAPSHDEPIAQQRSTPASQQQISQPTESIQQQSLEPQLGKVSQKIAATSEEELQYHAEENLQSSSEESYSDVAIAYSATPTQVIETDIEQTRLMEILTIPGLPNGVSIGVDVRALTYPELVDRGIGHYTEAHLHAIIQMSPNWRYSLLLAHEEPSPAIQRLLQFPNCRLHRFGDASCPKLDIFHTPDQMSMLFNYDAALRIAPSCRAITVTFYDLLPVLFREQYLDAWPPRLRQEYVTRLKQLEQSTAHVLSISESTRQDLLSFTAIAPNRITTILGGAPSTYAPVPRADIDRTLMDLTIKEPFFLTVGGLDPHKNFDRTLQAMVLARSHQHANLVVVGSLDDPWKERYRQACEAHHIYDVHFVGFIPRPMLEALYASATALLFPSLYEGLGLPILEAMAHGCPVITSNTSSLPELAGEAAVLIDPQDARSLARAMVIMLRDKGQRENLIQLGLEQSKKFTWTDTALKTIKTWTDLLGITAKMELEPMSTSSPDRATLPA